MYIKHIIVFALVALVNTTFAQTKEVSREWVSFQQEIAVKTQKKVNFILRAKLKTESAQSNSVSALWASVSNKNEEYGFQGSIQDSLVASQQWSSYEIKGNFDEYAEKITFGGYVVSNGSFYFDDFELLFQEEGKDYVPIKIANPNFDEVVKDDTIPGWLQDTDKEKNILKIKGYTFGTATHTIDNNKSLMIIGKDVAINKDNYIKAEEGFSPQIGTLISMLNNLSRRVEQVVKNLDLRETDHLMDEKANRIGALIMHLAAAEKIYQNLTFEHRRFNDAEKKEWQSGLSLGEEARKEFVGKPITYYLDIYKKTRQKTIEELRKRDDDWLEASWPGSTMNNHFAWFHVMEHQSSHLGQILMMKKRIPKKEHPTPTLEEKVD